MKVLILVLLWMVSLFLLLWAVGMVIVRNTYFAEMSYREWALFVLAVMGVVIAAIAINPSASMIGPLNSDRVRLIAVIGGVALCAVATILNGPSQR